MSMSLYCEKKIRLLIKCSSDWMWNIDHSGSTTFACACVCVCVAVLQSEVCVHHRTLQCVNTGTDTHSGVCLRVTQSIPQRMLLSNDYGTVEGCHFEKIGFHFTDGGTGWFWRNMSRLTFNHPPPPSIQPAHSVSLTAEQWEMYREVQ